MRNQNHTKAYSIYLHLRIYNRIFLNSNDENKKIKLKYIYSLFFLNFIYKGNASTI